MFARRLRDGLPLLMLALQKSFGVNRSHAARACGGYGLPVNDILHVAGGEYAFHARLRSAMRDDVTSFVQFNLSGKGFRIRIVSNRHKGAVHRNRSLSGAIRFAHHDSFHSALARVEHFFNDVGGQEFNFRIRARAIDHDLRRAEIVAPVDQRHLACKARQKIRLFHRGIAAADHRDIFAAEEISVAGGASRDAVPHQFPLGLKPQHSRRCARGDDQRAAFIILSSRR